MRIALIAPEIPDYALEYAELLAQTCQILLVVPERFKPTTRIPTNCAIELLSDAWPRQRSLRNVLFMFLLAKKVKTWAPDIVHILDGNHMWIPFFLRLIPKLQIATTVHDVTVHPGDKATARIPRFFLNYLVNRSSGVIVHGEEMKTAAAEVFSKSEAQIYVFPHPPIRHYSRLASSLGLKRSDDKIFRILFFGRLHEYKGLSYLAEAYEHVEMSPDQFKITIAGRGDDLSKLVSSETDLSKFEIINEFIDDEGTAKLFSDSDLLVLPYTEASQSGVLLISMSFGLPVVATNVGEMAEMVRENQMGIIVPSRDAISLGRAITAMASPELRERTRQSILSAMSERYSPDRLSEQALRIYQTICTGENDQTFQSRGIS